MTDWGALYREHVADVSALATGLTQEELERTVPGSPLWDVHDVYAHLAGGPADQVNDRTDGAPGPEWTARHVGERSEVPVADLVAELQSHQDAIVATLVDNPRPAVVWDMAVHHADLHEALGHRQLADHLWLPIVETLAPLRAPSITDAVPPYELFRGLFSRRSRGQMQAWGTELTAEELDGVCIFGPRDDDQPVPA